MQSEAYKDDEAEQIGIVKNGVKCHRCETNIEKGTLFCPTCGLPVIKNILNGKYEAESPDNVTAADQVETENLQEEYQETIRKKESYAGETELLTESVKVKRKVNRLAALGLVELLVGTAFSWVFCVVANVQGILSTEVTFWLLFLLLIGNAGSALILAVAGLISSKKNSRKLGFPVVVMVMACLGMLATLLLYLQAIL